MNQTKRSRSATTGWLLTLAGIVAAGTLAYNVLATDYRRTRLLSLIQGDAGVDGIGVQSWLLIGSPLLIVGLGVALIAASSERSPAR
jgi:hypothetical protein